MKKFIFLISMALFTISSSAQLKVNNSGKVAIAATNSDFLSRLSVGDNCHLWGDYSLGIAATPLLQENKRNVGVEGYINSWSSSFTSDTNIGVFGYAKVNKNHGRNFGVLGTIDYDYLPICVGGAGVYATCHGSYSYFPTSVQGMYALYVAGPSQLNGSTTAQSVYISADERLNDNVSSIETRKGETTLDNLLKMDVLEFNMKSLEKAVEPKAGEEMTEEAKRSYESLKKEEEELYSRRHFGLSAKELEKVYPNLVLKGQDGYQYINYTELVPILIRSIQELKAELDEVKSKDTEVKRARAASFEEDEPLDVKDATSIPAMATLAQNTPNPFSERTTIRFTLPENAQNAFIYIFDMSGKMQKQIPVDNSMESVIIEGYELRAGMYIYSLVIGGKEIDTKRMILSK
ncbi:T9SS type A sorting domain-containing protein [uncultured Prevotella sp.]|uniref:T9SS type A sorting domain-containing protein n=1 Tax=uncultured Prevotella sp. TaxID=159272 RepID=UPI002590DB6E|nr:T9SS type A sorting domain-containing protein [uncultured Prevotella sp.]